MLRQEYDLAAVTGVVSNLAVDGLHDRVRLTPDENRARHVFRGARSSGGGYTRSGGGGYARSGGGGARGGGGHGGGRR